MASSDVSHELISNHNNLVTVKVVTLNRFINPFRKRFHGTTHEIHMEIGNRTFNTFMFIVRDHIVESQDSYGYEISQTVKIVADIKESTLYPILKKLEKNGYLTTYSQEFQGRKRKYYSITDSGKEQLVYLNKEWISYRDTIDGIIEGRIRN